jgi:AmmeMemoRadiSam system protein B
VLPDAVAPALGTRIGDFLNESDMDAVIMGTTDLTHYGDAYMFTPSGYGPKAHEWMRENDGRIIKLAEAMKAEDIVPEANKSMNACGAGAMAATVAAARALGCGEGLTIEYTTSYDVVPEREFRMAVGYVGMAFCAG